MYIEKKMNNMKNFMLWLMFWCYQISRSRIYADQDVYLYSINQTTSLADALLSNITLTPKELELWKNQSNSNLVMSQRASEKEDVPVWKSIEERLKDIDLFVTAVKNVISELHTWSDVKVNSGTSGVLMLHNGTNSAGKRQLMYSWDTEHKRMVPIPKFVYRIIQTHCSYVHELRNLEDHIKDHYAVIVIHNNPTNGSNGDFIDCQSCSGWDAIKTENNEAGLTDVCHFTEELSRILGIDGYDPDASSLDLDSMPYSYSDNWEWTSLTCEREDSDQTYAIQKEYQKLKEGN